MDLLERDEFLQALGEYADEAAAGSGRFVMVAGEAGIGKTSLIEAFQEGRDDLRWLWGACDGSFTPQPLGPVHEIALSVGGSLVELFGPDVDRRLLFSAFLADLQRSSRPTVVVVEDVHWADDATLDWLIYLARRVSRSRTLIIVSYRDDVLADAAALRAAVGQIVTFRSTARITLPPLSRGAVGSLVSHDAEEVFRVTGGNPFFVRELAEAGLASIPATVTDAVLARMSVLEQGPRHLLQAASVLGQPGRAELLGSIADSPPSGLDDCLKVGALVEEPLGFRFRHELVRRAVEESIPPYRRAQLHARALAALRAVGVTDDARLAHHADGAGDRAAAVTHALAAGEAAAALSSNREAAVQFRRALRHADGAEAELLVRIHDGLATALGYQDLWADSLEHREESVAIRRQLGDREELSRSLRALSHTYWRLCRADEDRKVADEYFALMRAAPDSAEKAMAIYHYLRFVPMGSTEHAELLAQLERIGAQVADPRVRSGILAERAYSVLDAEPDAALSLQQEAVTVARDGGDDIAAAVAYTNLYEFAVARHRLDDFDWAYHEGIAFITDRDIPTYDKCLAGSRLTYLLRKGRLDDVRTAGLESMQPPLSPVNELFQLIPYTTAALRAGSADGRDLLERVQALARDATEVGYRIATARVTAEAAWLTGEGALIDDEVLGYAASAHDSDAWAYGELVSWLRRLGHDIEVRRELPVPFALEVAEENAAAAAYWRERGCPFEEGAALFFDGGRESLRRAHELFASIGAPPAEALARRSLRALGEDVRGPRQTTRDNRHGLTSREAEVLELLMAGLTNQAIADRLVISRRTVDHHVSSVLAKTGATSRVELQTATT